LIPKQRCGASRGVVFSADKSSWGKPRRVSLPEPRNLLNRFCRGVQVEKTLLGL